MEPKNTPVFRCPTCGAAPTAEFARYERRLFFYKLACHGQTGTGVFDADADDDNAPARTECHFEGDRRDDWRVG